MAIIRDFEAARAVRLQIREAMHIGTTSIDDCIQEKVAAGTPEIPAHVFSNIPDFSEVSKSVLLSVVPEHGLAKHQSEWHLVDQSFQRGRRLPASGKVGMSPGPEVAVTVSAVVALQPEAERVPLKAVAVECDLPREDRVGMRGP